MKRYNLIQARGAEFTCGTEGIAIEGEGNDVIEWNVKRGIVSMIVPANLADGEVCEECFDRHTCLDIELEDGTRITGWVRGGEAHLEAEFPSRRRKRATRARPLRRSKKPLVRHSMFSKRTATE
jgi:hypothetical protein